MKRGTEYENGRTERKNQCIIILKQSIHAYMLYVYFSDISYAPIYIPFSL